MVHSRLSFLGILLWAAFCQNAFSEYFFLNTKTDYGSKVMYNPMHMWANGAFDIMQTDTERRSPKDVPYREAWKNLSRNLEHPIDAVQRYGGEEFLKNEVIPLGFSLNTAQYVPNYNLHLIGGGLVYRHLYEWYALRGVPTPRLFAIVNCLAYHTVNEMVENGNYQGVNVDPIADMYLFNPLGWILFSYDTPTRFFAKTLNASDWSGMPMVDPVAGLLDNASLNWSFKWYPIHNRGLGLFAYSGMNGITGFSWRRMDGLALSGGLGLATREVIEVDRDGEGEGRKNSVNLVWSSGLFIDRENSLLASILISGQRLYRMRANLYPLGGENWWNRLGYFMGYGRDKRMSMGITGNLMPVGVALGTTLSNRRHH